mgnify:CR=1 FL=1
MSLVKTFARSALRLLPDEGRSIKAGARELSVQKELVRWELAQYFCGITVPDPRTVYWIDPERREELAAAMAAGRAMLPACGERAPYFRAASAQAVVGAPGRRLAAGGGGGAVSAG